MTLEEARKSPERHPVRDRSGHRAQTVFNFPEDIYVNTKLAYRHGRNAADLLRAGHRTERTAGHSTADGRYRYFSPVGDRSMQLHLSG
jgi:hypothetical protein